MLSRFVCSLLLSSFLVLCISARDVVKREAPEGRFYVYSSLEGCSAVQSKDPCPVNGNLPSFFAKTYEAQNNFVETKINMSKAYTSPITTIDPKCIPAIEALYCSRITPRCTQDSTADFGDTKALCDKINASCLERFTNEICGYSLPHVQSNSKKCTAPTKPMEGICPQPKYKMPADILKQYLQASKEFVSMFNGIQGIASFSDDCLSKLKNMFCMPLACSADEKRVLVKHDRNDCTNVVKSCLGKSTWSTSPVADKLVKTFKKVIEASCELYPISNATKTEGAPPPANPVAAAACNLPELLLFLVCLIFMFVA